MAWVVWCVDECLLDLRHGVCVCCVVSCVSDGVCIIGGCVGAQFVPLWPALHCIQTCHHVIMVDRPTDTRRYLIKPISNAAGLPNGRQNNSTGAAITSDDVEVRVVLRGGVCADPPLLR